MYESSKPIITNLLLLLLTLPLEAELGGVNDELLRAKFGNVPPMISIIAIEVVTTTPNKICAFVFDKMVYVLTTDLIIITDSNRNMLRIRLFVVKKR